MEKLNQRNYIEEFCCEMQYRNYSERTIKTYKELLERFQNCSKVPLNETTTDQLKAYLHNRLTVESVSVSTINQCISAFKILHVDVLGREWEQFKIKRPRGEVKLPTVLSQEEVEKMISVTSNIKHKAILLLTYSAGLRRQELQQIKPSAIDSKRMLVQVSQGKGKKDRLTILSKKALEILRIYYAQYRPKVYLFETQMIQGQYLAETSLAKIVKNSAKKAGIKKEVSFHTLRHCFATHLMESGVNLKMVQKFMGHNSIRTTARYLHLANIDPAKIVSPADLMNL
jgi:integrase/recombinase XerD